MPSMSVDDTRSLRRRFVMQYRKYKNGPVAGYLGWIENKATGKVAFWIEEDGSVTPDHDIG